MGQKWFILSMRHTSSSRWLSGRYWTRTEFMLCCEDLWERLKLDYITELLKCLDTKQKSFSHIAWLCIRICKTSYLGGPATIQQYNRKIHRKMGRALTRVILLNRLAVTYCIIQPAHSPENSLSISTPAGLLLPTEFIYCLRERLIWKSEFSCVNEWIDFRVMESFRHKWLKTNQDIWHVNPPSFSSIIHQQGQHQTQ